MGFRNQMNKKEKENIISRSGDHQNTVPISAKFNKFNKCVPEHSRALLSGLSPKIFRRVSSRSRNFHTLSVRILQTPLPIIVVPRASSKSYELESGIYSAIHIELGTLRPFFYQTVNKIKKTQIPTTPRDVNKQDFTDPSSF